MEHPLLLLGLGLVQFQENPSHGNGVLPWGHLE